MTFFLIYCYDYDYYFCYYYLSRVISERIPILLLCCVLSDGTSKCIARRLNGFKRLIQLCNNRTKLKLKPLLTLQDLPLTFPFGKVWLRLV